MGAQVESTPKVAVFQGGEVSVRLHDSGRVGGRGEVRRIRVGGGCVGLSGSNQIQELEVGSGFLFRPMNDKDIWRTMLWPPTQR